MINKTSVRVSAVILAGIILSLFFISSAQATSLADQVREPIIMNAWKTVLSIVNVVAILGLIFIAITNILRINIEAFNVRRLLPALVLAIIFANFSHLICRLFIDFANVFTIFFKEGINPNLPIDARTVGGAFGITQPVGAEVTFGAAAVLAVIAGFLLTPVGGLIIFVILAIIIFLFPTFLIFIMALMMYVRLYVIWFLVIMSPLAFFGLFFEPLKAAWSMWWSWFLKWLMIAPIAFFFLRLAVEVGDVNVGPMLDTTETVSNFAKWIFGLGMLGLAIYMPYSLGGQVMGLVRGLLARAAALGWQGGTIAKRGIGQRLAEGQDQNSLRARIGKGMARDYGMALQTRMADLESFAKRATHEGGLTRTVAAGWQQDQPFNPADLEILKAEQARMSSAKTARDVENLSRGLDLTNIEQYNNPRQRRDYYRAMVARDTLAGMAIQNHQHDAFQSLQQRFTDVDPEKLSDDDRDFYNRVMTTLPETAHGHVEIVHGERHAETPESNYTRQRADHTEQHLTMDDAQLAHDQGRVTAALGHLRAGRIDDAKVTAKALLRVMPEAEIEAISPQQLAEQLHERMNSNQITRAIKTAGRPPQEIRERVRIRAYQDYSVEQMAQAAGRLNIPGANRAARTTEMADRLRGTTGTPQEQQAARETVVPHINHVLDQVPSYQLSDQAIAHHLGIQPDPHTKRFTRTQQHAIATERTTRQAARNTATADIINHQADRIAEIAENFRGHGQFDRLNDNNIDWRNEIINQINTHIP